MKTVQKFTTFDDLKASERKTTVDCTSSLKRHDDFEEVVMSIRAVKIEQDKLLKPKP